MQPRSLDDLHRRGVGLRRISELSMGVMGRTPDYLNVTFAGFADDRPRWAGPDASNTQGYENLVAFQKRLRPRRPVADPHDRAPDRRQGGRRGLRQQPGAVAQGRRDRRLDHRPWRPPAGHSRPVRRRADRLPRRAPSAGSAARVRPVVHHRDGHAGTGVPVPRQRHPTRRPSTRRTVLHPLRRAGRAPTGSPPTASTARPTEPAATNCSPS